MPAWGFPQYRSCCIYQQNKVVGPLQHVNVPGWNSVRTFKPHTNGARIFILLFNVTYKPPVGRSLENHGLMQAVYARSSPQHPTPPNLPYPACFKSHLIGPVWSHASISIHLQWPWLDLMWVKEVFASAVHTLIVCLEDLVNWKRRKWSQSVRLIGSVCPHLMLAQ